MNLLVIRKNIVKEFQRWRMKGRARNGSAFFMHSSIRNPQFWKLPATEQLCKQ